MNYTSKQFEKESHTMYIIKTNRSCYKYTTTLFLSQRNKVSRRIIWKYSYAQKPSYLGIGLEKLDDMFSCFGTYYEYEGRSDLRKTRSSADADNRLDAFSGQSRSTNMVPFHMLYIVSYCAIETLSLRRAVFSIFVFKKIS